MSEIEYQAADLRGPVNTWVSTASGMGAPTGPNQVRTRALPSCEIVALLCASGVSQQFDLQATGFFGDAMYSGKFVRMIGESTGDAHYAWATSTGCAIDRTATGGATGVAAFLASRTATDELPGGRFLLVQPSTTGIFRVWITNRTT